MSSSLCVPLAENLSHVRCGKHTVLPFKLPRICVWALHVPVWHNTTVKCHCDTKVNNNMWSSGPEVITWGEHNHYTQAHSCTHTKPLSQWTNHTTYTIESSSVWHCSFLSSVLLWHCWRKKPWEWPGEEGTCPVKQRRDAGDKALSEAAMAWRDTERERRS